MPATKDRFVMPRSQGRVDGSARKSLDAVLRESVFEHFKNDPDTAMALIDPESRVVFCNEACARMLRKINADEAIGRTLEDLFPPELSQRWTEHVRGVLKSQRPLATRDLLFGKQIIGCLRPVEECDTPVILYTGRHVTSLTAEVPVGTEYIETDVVELGPLDELTARELEVLALFGQGLISKEAAAVLGCSPRTIEVHKRSMAQKLGESDRVELAKLALAAGLTRDDATRTRVQIDDDDAKEDV